MNFLRSLVFVLLLLSACSQKKKERLSDRSFSVSQQEARLADLYIPFDAQPLPYFFSKNINDSDMLGYRSLMDKQVLIAKCALEMERLGWYCLGQFVHDHETVLVFDKPKNLCTISLRSPKGFSGKGVVMVIMRGQKEEGYS